MPNLTWAHSLTLLLTILKTSHLPRFEVNGNWPHVEKPLRRRSKRYLEVGVSWAHFHLIERLRNSSVNAKVTVKVNGNWAHFDLIERLRNPSVNANVTVKVMEFRAILTY